MKNEQEIVRAVFDAYIRDIKAVNEKHEPTIDMLEEVKNRAIKALEQNTVSEEVYNDEYIARKQAEYELWKIKKQQSSEDYKGHIFSSTASELSTSKDSWCDGDYENCDYRDNCSYADNCSECADFEKRGAEND